MFYLAVLYLCVPHFHLGQCQWASCWVATVGREALVNDLPFACLDLCPGGGPMDLPYALASYWFWQEFRERKKGDQSPSSMTLSQ